MKAASRSSISIALLGTVLLGSGAQVCLAQGAGPPDQPAVTVRGQTYTPRSILARNMGTEEDQTTAFTPVVIEELRPGHEAPRKFASRFPLPMAVVTLPVPLNVVSKLPLAL